MPKTANKRLLPLIFLFILSWSLVFGWGAATAINPDLSKMTKSVDKATGNYKVGEEMYLENCSSCHIPLPPAVLPRETWKTILENPYDHYGTKINGLVRFTQVLIWEYLSNYSRQLLANEVKPDYIAQSRYFFALHPQVKLPNPVTHHTCIECHPQASDFNYRVETE
jgi:hypothetical protein